MSRPAVLRQANDSLPDLPATALRWQASFYRTYLATALTKLANDPNPDVRRMGRHMDQCLRCPRMGRCSECPFGPGAEARLR